MVGFRGAGGWSDGFVGKVKQRPGNDPYGFKEERRKVAEEAARPRFLIAQDAPVHLVTGDEALGMPHNAIRAVLSDQNHMDITVLETDTGPQVRIHLNMGMIAVLPEVGNSVRLEPRGY